MIKRRFYKQEHVDHDGASDDSDSSSSDSDSPPHKEDSDDDGVEEDEDHSKGVTLSPPSRSGYESEDSSGNEVGCDSSGLVLCHPYYASCFKALDVKIKPSAGLPVNEEEGSEEGRLKSKDDQLVGEGTSKAVAKETIPKDLIPDPDNSILKFKSVFKCRLCPRIVCLSESTIRAHLSSKRHARSKKLLGEGRLKLILNSDGEIEEEQETHAERHARTIALAQEKDSPKKDKGRKRQRKRRIKKTNHASDNGGGEKSSKREKKKGRKVED